MAPLFLGQMISNITCLEGGCGVWERVWHFICLEGIQNESDFFIQYVVRPNGHSGDQVPKVIYVKKKKKKSMIFLPSSSRGYVNQKKKPLKFVYHGKRTHHSFVLGHVTLGCNVCVHV